MTPSMPSTPKSMAIDRLGYSVASSGLIGKDWLCNFKLSPLFPSSGIVSVTTRLWNSNSGETDCHNRQVGIVKPPIHSSPASLACQKLVHAYKMHSVCMRDQSSQDGRTLPKLQAACHSHLFTQHGSKARSVVTVSSREMFGALGPTSRWRRRKSLYVLLPDCAYHLARL